MLVAPEFFQSFGIDSFDIYGAVVRMMSFRVIFAPPIYLHLFIDVNVAFNPELKEDVYIEASGRHKSKAKGMVLTFNKGLYDLE